MATLPEIMRMIEDTRAELTELDTRIAQRQAEAHALATRLHALDDSHDDVNVPNMPTKVEEPQDTPETGVHEHIREIADIGKAKEPVED